MNDIICGLSGMYHFNHFMKVSERLSALGECLGRHVFLCVSLS